MSSVTQTPTKILIELKTDVTVWQGVLFLGAHVPLGFLLNRFPQLALLHAIIALLIGLKWAISKCPMAQAAFVAGYITGAEVLWRMTGSPLPWEFGKYATSAILVVSLIRHKQFSLPALPLFYFILLLPAVVPTVMHYYFLIGDVRQLLSFNLSGPFSLMVSAWFFSKTKLRSPDLDWLFLAIMAPALGTGAFTLLSTVTASSITFGTYSNVSTSGGYGPNQVSSVLALGALMAFLFLLKSKTNNLLTGAVFVVMLFLASQSALTFSRGGLIGALGAGAVALICLTRDPSARKKAVLIPLLAVLITAFMIFPRLNSFTGGYLSRRFENTNTTGRSELVQSDLRIFDENMFLGAGVGMSLFRVEGWKPPHTEFSRLLAEHGLFGLAALLLLILAAFSRFLSLDDHRQRAFAGAMITWSFLFMLDKAMRLVAPSFIYGFAFTGFADHSAQKYKLVEDSEYYQSRWLCPESRDRCLDEVSTVTR